MGDRLPVYVPARGSELEETVWPGSGLVGSEGPDGGRVRVAFEGDREDCPTYEQRTKRAAELHLAPGSDGDPEAPGRGRARVEPHEVVRVGWWDPDAEELEITEPGAVDGWLG